MRFMTAILVLLTTVPAMAQTGAGASRRHGELTPLQYNFGPFTAVAPYNNQPGYTLLSNAQVQPASTISDNNAFASTSNFTAIRQDDATTTFSVASNVGTITTGSASGANYVIGSSASSFSIPDTFIEVEIMQNGTTSGTDHIALGMTAPESGSNPTLQINAEVDMVGRNCFMHVLYAGTDHVLGSASFTAPSAPWYLGFSLMGSQATAFYNSGSGWQQITTGDVSSYYDPRTSGNLTGFQTAVKLFTSQATTWKLANLKTGLFGGTGMRDVALVTYPDGRPYMRGSVAYFIASIGGFTSTTLDSGNAIFSYDLVSGTLTMLGSLGVSRSSAVYEDQAGDIIYDPINNQERLLIGTWATTSNAPATVYTSQSISTDDWLSGGPHVTPAASTVTVPSASSNYDANMACTSWNYSASTCSLWTMAIVSGNPGSGVGSEFLSSTADPSANSWSVLASTSNLGYEGSRILRTATTSGSKGVSYFGAWGGKIGSAVRTSSIYSPAGSSLGALNAPWPAGTFNPSHPELVAFGNTEYLISFADVLWGTASGSIGNFAVSSAPKYVPQTNWPTLVNTGSTFSGSSTVSSVTLSTGDYASSFTFTAGDLVIAVGRGNSASETTMSITDSLGDTFTCGTINSISPSGATGYDFGCYSFVTHSGTATFTHSIGTSANFVGLTVEQFRPGFLTSVDNGVSYSNIVTGSKVSLYTSNAFSTSAKGLVIVCPDALFNAGTFQPGLIGPYAASFGAGFSSGAAPCIGTLTNGAQTSITATLNNGLAATGWWGGTIMSFK
ncbi:hypothetical protein H7849_11975 [Alloacidobacterium dinghuense]|uniref:Uncharacterized protein n=1 Tax=Alloacidobacterium dinghuense TaxID=2763107 RepID=A0A7G8BPS4_9BACT|nr:hypothetical protein [Alloacidobacterium dinghuense]QNI34544.1 hypothetical protein H7849_11975 [Alloacidobacterium dinghuense]